MLSIFLERFIFEYVCGYNEICRRQFRCVLVFFCVKLGGLYYIDFLRLGTKKYIKA